MRSFNMSARQWRTPLAAIAMSGVVAVYVHYSMRAAKEEYEAERKMANEEQERRRVIRRGAYGQQPAPEPSKP